MVSESKCQQHTVQYVCPISLGGLNHEYVCPCWENLFLLRIWKKFLYCCFQISAKESELQSFVQRSHKAGVKDYETYSFHLQELYALAILQSSKRHAVRGSVSTCGAKYAHVSYVTRSEIKPYFAIN